MLKRSEYKERMSRRGRCGAKVRWQKYHDEVGPQIYPPELPQDCFRLTIENMIAGKTHIMVFHPGSRRGRYKVDVDGEFWKECGWSDALVRIRKSCKLMAEHLYD